MKKIYSFLVLIIVGTLILPSITMAVWWNPFTWFNKKIEPQPQPQVQIQNMAPEVPIVEAVSFKETPKQDVVPKKTVTPVVNSQVIIPQLIPPVSVIELSIYDVDVEPDATSVKVSWRTNISSESKVLFEGQSYVSQSGVGAMHSVTINGLESDLFYNGVITAIANNAWKSEKFNFTTKASPLKITVVSKNCPTDKCTFSWKTNYKSDSRIKIRNAQTDKLVKSVDSSSENSKEHNLEVSLEPNTEYTFEIYATTDTEWTEIGGNISTGSKPLERNNTCTLGHCSAKA